MFIGGCSLAVSRLLFKLPHCGVHDVYVLLLSYSRVLDLYRDLREELS